MNNQELHNSLKRISIGNDGSQGNGYSGSISLSDDGQLIPFESNANNLLDVDINNATDIFLYDDSDQTIELVSIATDGTQANGDSSSASISGDGNYISFTSSASNLAANDTNGLHDIFLRDRLNQYTALISVAADGSSANGISLMSAVNDTGGYVAFESLASNLVSNDTNGLADIFLRDRFNQTTELVSVAADGTSANGSSSLGSISDDGQYISYISDADNIVAGDINGATDIFVYDRLNQTTELISLGLDGAAANGMSEQASISDDGRYIAFLSDADNLVADDTNSSADIFVRDLLTQTTQKIDVDSFPLLSGDAQSLVFNSSLSGLVADDTNTAGDVFLMELEVATLEPPVTEPPVTEPPVTEPPVTEPPVTEPPVIEPPVTEPPVTEPPVTEPPVTEPPVTEPPVTEPPVTEPPVTEPPVTEPPVTEPPVTEPPVTEPPVTEPPVTEPPVTEPPVTEPPVTEPPVTEPPIIEDIDLNHLNTDNIHRFYESDKGFHLYATDDSEIQNMKQNSTSEGGLFRDESEKFTVLTDNLDNITGEEIEGVIPVYQFFNSDTQAYLYTSDENEIEVVETFDNYSDGSIAYYAFESQPTEIETIPVFRMLNTSSNSHFYTTDQNELNYIRNNLSNFQMENQGEAVFYVLDL